MLSCSISIDNTYKQNHPIFAKFLDLLDVYRLMWKYVPGAKNVVADYICRNGHDSQPELQFDHWDELATEITLKAVLVDENATNTSEPSLAGTSNEAIAPDPQDTVNNQRPNVGVDQGNFQAIHENEQPSPIPATQPNLTLHDDEPVIYKRPSNVSLPDILIIKELLESPGTPIPERLSEIFLSFYLKKDILYIVFQNCLHRVFTDYDFLRLASKVHSFYHCSHRVLI
ncbi:hypothetical protein C6P45_003226 [Maudiozyma exigua]|uniref:Reverse transcriptase RNase H-like domain-containing protein n=1 Tax=Maudiozyma exigua TaxID=34358 RepID=A0A9P7B2I8_MAUEX|nr:hypothetical protein C6P45_003226 [Kazachstania exigua]